MKKRMVDFYMSLAENCSTMSRAVRLKVGCVIVKNNNIISFSWNGTPTGWDNCCEDQEWMPEDKIKNFIQSEIEKEWPFTIVCKHSNIVTARYKLKTKPEVLHAEMNALMKLARSSESGNNASLFVTHSPCIECAKGIYQSGIKTVYYKNEYRSTQGIDFLHKCNIEVNKI